MGVGAMNRVEALKRLRECLAGRGRIILGAHFRAELKAENLAIVDAWRVLGHGHIYNPPEFDVAYGDWKYQVEGPTPDGVALAIVFCFKEIDRVFVITCFSISKRRQVAVRLGGNDGNRRVR
jgi:hypothetical protein